MCEGKDQIDVCVYVAQKTATAKIGEVIAVAVCRVLMKRGRLASGAAVDSGFFFGV